jgi:oligoribonuclease
MPKLVWLDLETTGLDPTKHRVLEVSCAVAELHDPFNVQFVYESTLYFPPNPMTCNERGHNEVQWAALEPCIVDMHTKNELFKECEHGVPAYVVDAELGQRFPFSDDKDERFILAGSSIHFDHAFIDVHFPLFARSLSHRHYDVSSIKLYCQSLGMAQFSKGEAHRAHADIVESIAHARACTDWLRASL